MRSICIATLNALSQAIDISSYCSRNNIDFLPYKDFNFIKSNNTISLVGYCEDIHRIRFNAIVVTLPNTIPLSNNILNNSSIFSNIPGTTATLSPILIAHPTTIKLLFLVRSTVDKVIIHNIVNISIITLSSTGFEATITNATNF